MHTLVLLNAHAGGGRTRAMQAALQAQLNTYAQPPLLFMTEDTHTAKKLTDALPAASRVIVAGGDGSVHALLPSLLAGGHTLGLLPMGSGNDTARALGVHGMSWRAALDHALHGKCSMMDVGEISYVRSSDGSLQRSLFISSIAAGFDAAVTQRALKAPGWLSGMPRYLWATLRELAALRDFAVELHADGQCLHKGKVLLASTLNMSSYGGGMPIAPGARIDSGQLDLLLAQSMSLARVAVLLPRMLFGQHLGQREVMHHRFAELKMQAATGLPIAADGEYLGEVSTATLQVRPSELSVVRYGVPH